MVAASRARSTILGVMGVLVVLLAGAALAIFPIPFRGALFVLTTSLALWLSIRVGIRAFDLAPRQRWLTGIGLALSLLPFALALNWSLLAPRAWFELHRPFYEAAADSRPESSDSGDYYGERLPLPLMWLSMDGNASWQCIACNGSDPDAPPALFFPQWFGVPDDAGGYAYSPESPPEGLEMYGMICQDPVDLGDGWWMCGM